MCIFSCMYIYIFYVLTDCYFDIPLPFSLNLADLPFFIYNASWLQQFQQLVFTWICYLWLLKCRVFTTWKVSVSGVFLVRIYPHWDWIRTRKTPNMDTSHAVFRTSKFRHNLCHVLEQISWNNFVTLCTTLSKWLKICNIFWISSVHNLLPSCSYMLLLFKIVS